MSDILNHPQLKDLNPETEREGLLYMKAYLEAIDATLKTVRQFGLEAAEAFHNKAMADLAGKIGDAPEETETWFCPVCNSLQEGKMRHYT